MNSLERGKIKSDVLQRYKFSGMRSSIYPCYAFSLGLGHTGVAARQRWVVRNDVHKASVKYGILAHSPDTCQTLNSIS